MTDCPNASEPTKTTVRCSLTPPGVRVNHRICAACHTYWIDAPPTTESLTPPLLDILDATPQPVRRCGLGDTIAAITKAIGIRPCGGCEKRRAWLNGRFPC